VTFNEVLGAMLSMMVVGAAVAALVHLIIGQDDMMKYPWYSAGFCGYLLAAWLHSLPFAPLGIILGMSGWMSYGRVIYRLTSKNSGK
jgi:hypothetical protein